MRQGEAEAGGAPAGRDTHLPESIVGQVLKTLEVAMIKHFAFFGRVL